MTEVIDFRKLDLGCGKWRKHGYLGIDIFEAGEYQQVIEADKQWVLPWDLNNGIPFPDNTIDDIYISHFIEHVISPEFLLYEIHRVCRHGAHVEIYVPLHEMMSKGHLTEFDEYWFERVFLKSFPGQYSIVSKSKRVRDNIPLMTPDGIVMRNFEELNIIFKTVK